MPKSEIYQCKFQPTDFVRGNVDLKTNGGYLMVVHVSIIMPVISTLYIRTSNIFFEIVYICT